MPEGRRAAIIYHLDGGASHPYFQPASQADVTAEIERPAPSNAGRHGHGPFERATGALINGLRLPPHSSYRVVPITVRAEPPLPSMPRIRPLPWLIDDAEALRRRAVNLK
jgi:hypothetical protein